MCLILISNGNLVHVSHFLTIATHVTCNLVPYRVDTTVSLGFRQGEFQVTQKAPQEEFQGVPQEEFLEVRLKEFQVNQVVQQVEFLHLAQ